MTTFTILAPVHRPPDLMGFAIASVLSQTRPDFELFIICDGAPEVTAEAARAYAAQDARIRAFVHPKGERNGEAWRHLALQGARGRIVCQIGDDDLWFPDHLAEVDALMAGADFGATLPLYLDADGAPRLQFTDIADPTVRRQMTEGRGNAFGPTPSAYRLETYRALPVGWSPAPPEMWTDLHMWRKFLALPGVRCATRFVATTLAFPQAVRRDWTLARRHDEVAACAARLSEPAFREGLWREALAAAAQRLVAVQVQLQDVRGVGLRLLGALNEADAALEAIAAASPPDAAALAKAALDRLPDRAWRQGLSRGQKPRDG